MDSRHGAENNLKVVIDDFHNGRQTVRSAGGIGNNVMLGGIVNLFVDAKHESDIFILGGSGNNDFLDRPSKMVIGVGEVAGRFHDDLSPDRFPRKLCRISFGKDLESLGVHGDAVGPSRDVIGQITENGVVLEQVSESFGVREIVDCDEFDVGIIERGAQYVASDAAETVNAYFNSHLASVRMMKI